MRSSDRLLDKPFLNRMVCYVTVVSGLTLVPWKEGMPLVWDAIRALIRCAISYVRDISFRFGRGP